MIHLVHLSTKSSLALLTHGDRATHAPLIFFQEVRLLLRSSRSELKASTHVVVAHFTATHSAPIHRNLSNSAF